MTEETDIVNGYTNEPVHKSKSPMDSHPAMTNGNGDIGTINESRTKPSVTNNQSSNDTTATTVQPTNLKYTENQGPNQILPSEDLWTSDPAGRIKIRCSQKDLEEFPPVSVPGLLNRTATEFPERIALALKQPDGKYEEITYKQYEENVRIVAKAFLHLGLERYNSVGIIGFNSPEWFYTDLAAIYAGGFAAGMYTTNSPDACHHCLESSRANLCVVEDDKQLQKILEIKDRLPYLKKIIQYTGKVETADVLSWEDVLKIGREQTDDKLNEVLKKIGVNECCTLVYTSGTEGKSKAVMLSHDNLTYDAASLTKHLNVNTSHVETLISYLPLSHVAAQVTDIYCPITVGAKVVFADKDALKGSLGATLAETHPTIFLGVPRVWEKIQEKMLTLGKQVSSVKRTLASWAKMAALQHHESVMKGNSSESYRYKLYRWLIFDKIKARMGLDQCKAFISAAAPISEDVKRYFMSLDILIIEAFGMSECAGAHTTGDLSKYSMKGVGVTLPGFETKLDNEKDGEGEICMKGRHVFMGYLGEPEKTKATNQYAKIIKKFLERKKLGNAIDVLETRMLKEDKVEPELYIYNLLISACAIYGNTKKAFQLFNKMKQRGLSPSASTYTSLFNACANCPYPHDGLKRIDHLREICLEKGHVLNHLNYHALIKAYGRCGSLENAFKVVDEMVDNQIRLSVDTFNFLLQACASDKEVGFRHALLVWRKMLTKGLKPGIYSFNLMLRCTRDCGLGNIEATKDVIKTILAMSPKSTNQIEMRRTSEKNHIIDADTINSSQSISHGNTSNIGISDGIDPVQIIDSPDPDYQLETAHTTTSNLPNLLAKCPHLGDMVDIEEIVKPEHRLLLIGGSNGFLEQMDASMVEPDLKTFTQLLESIPSTLSSEQALLRAISDRKVTLDIDFFNILIKKRSLRGDYKNAKAVLKMIRQHKLSPDIVTFGVLSLSCTTMEEAIELRESIEEVGYRINVEILGGLLKKACVEWDCNYILFVLKVLVEEGVTPSPEFMETVKRFYNSVNGFIKNERVIERKEKTSKYLDKVRDAEFLNDFKNFSNYYKKFRVKVLVDVPTNHYKQFKKHDDPEDFKLMNTGRN